MASPPAPRGLQTYCIGTKEEDFPYEIFFKKPGVHESLRVHNAGSCSTHHQFKGGQMMKRLSRFLLPSLVLVLGATAAFAQGMTTSSVTGTVMHEGAPLPGVTVTASSPSLQGTRTAVTGERGDYFLGALPPGDYAVTFEMEGMQTVRQTTRVSLAQTSRVDAVMRLSAVAEAITVTATAPAVLETTQVGTNVTTKMLDSLPVGRTITAAVLMAPGVSSVGIAGPSISGAPSYDNVYLVNGVVVNENLRGQPHNLFIEDAVQETTILTGGISAEYGRFTGGVINTITKSGGNEFSGSFRDNFTNPDWRKKTPWPTEADHLDVVSEIYEATLGGRIIRDRLWFFGAGRLRETSDQRFTSVTNLPYAFGVEETRLEGKLTGQITSKHSLVASYIDITDERTNDIQFTVMDYGSLFNRSLPNSLGTVIYNGILTTNFLVEANYGEKEFAFVNSGSPFRDRIFGTLMVDSPTGRRYWTSTFCGVCTPEERNNEAWQVKGTYYLSTAAMGSHNIAAGLEDYAETRIANNHQSGSDFRILGNIVQQGTDIFPRLDSNTLIQWNPIFTFSQGTDLQSTGVYVNDRWDLSSHWNFNLGVRFDMNDAKDADGNTVSDDSGISPRLGAQFDIFGDGRHRINANYGRYVAKIADGNVAGSAQGAGNPSVFQWRYRGPEINPPGTSPLLTTDQALQILWNWFDSVGGTDNKEFLVTAGVAGLSAQIPEAISSPSVDEFTIGYAVQLGRNAFLRTDLVAREWSNFYASRIDTSTPKSLDQFGNRGDVAFLQNDDSLEREYLGVQLQGQWRPGRAFLGGAYTYSELKGNDEGEAGPTATSPNTPLHLFYPEFLSYAQRRPVGWLPEDVRHRARAWIGYELPIPVIGRFNGSLLHTFETGSPYSAIGVIDATGRTTGTAYTGIPANPGYTFSQIGSQHRYFFSERGSFRTDDYNRTDAALTYNLPIWKVEFFAQALVTNIFDNNAVTWVDNGAGGPDTTIFTRRTSSTRGLRPFNPFTETPIECPQDAVAATCTQMGAHWQKGPNFGKPFGVSSFQIPTTYSFTAGIRF
jgi:outer membrane receptor protein involved in Fe transport